MVTLGWLLVSVLVVLAGLLTILAITIRGWRLAISFAAGASALFTGAVVLGAMIVKLSSPAPPAPNVGSGKDFYQVQWEEKTDRGTTVVVVKDSSGKFYFSEFDEPLKVKKVLVVEKERFKPLLLSEKPEESKKVVPVPQK